MKKLGLLLIIASVLISCKKDDNDQEEVLSMTIDGKDLSFDNAFGFQAGPGEYLVTAGNDSITIEFNIVLGENNENRELSLGPGGDADINVTIGTDSIFSTTTTNSSGTLSISAVSNSRIEGTFSFVAYQFFDDSGNSISVENGVLKATIVSN